MPAPQAPVAFIRRPDAILHGPGPDAVRTASGAGGGLRSIWGLRQMLVQPARRALLEFPGALVSGRSAGAVRPAGPIRTLDEVRAPGDPAGKGIRDARANQYILRFRYRCGGPVFLVLAGVGTRGAAVQAFVF